METNQQKINILRAKEDYSNKNVANQYQMFTKEIGLWASEEFVFNKFVQKQASVLDVGCGAGRTTFGLYKLGYTNIRGVDVSKRLIKMAKSNAKDLKTPINFDVMDAMALKFQSNSFDAVLFSYNGLMTIPKKENRQMAVNEISRVLKPGGMFIFTTHDRENGTQYSEFWKEEKLKWENNTQDPRLYEFGDRLVSEAGEELFVHIPNLKEVYSLLAAAGLKCVFTKMRWDICATPKIEKDVFGECRFFVAKKDEK